MSRNGELGSEGPKSVNPKTSRLCFRESGEGNDGDKDGGPDGSRRME